VLPVSLAGLFALMIMSSADLSSAFLKIGCEPAPHWPLRSHGTGLAQYLDLAAFAFSCLAIVIVIFRRRKWAASWWSDRVEIQISWLYVASCCLMFLFQGETPIGTHVLVFASPMGFAALYALSIAPSSKRSWWVLLGFLLMFLAFESYWHIQVQLLFTLTALTLFAFLWLNDKRKWLSIAIAIVLALGLILVQYSLIILSLNGYWIG